MAKELRRTNVDAEIQEAVDIIESALSEAGYMGFFDIMGGAAHVDHFYFNDELHVREGNQWFVRMEVK